MNYQVTERSANVVRDSLDSQCNY